MNRRSPSINVVCTGFVATLCLSPWVKATDRPENTQVAVASVKNENREATTWEEPALFPPENTPAPIPIRQAVKTPDLQENIGPASTFAVSPEPSGIRPGSLLTTPQRSLDSRTFGGASVSPLGLRSGVEREAVLARLTQDTSSASYNIKIGRIPFVLSGGVDFEFSDNIFHDNAHRRADLEIIPRLDLSGAVRLGSAATLTMGVGVGYIKYLAGTQDDRFLTTASLSPNTGLSFDFKVANFIISVYDQPSVPQFQTDSSTQRNPVQYNQFQNSAGVSLLWNVNSKANVSVRYGHTNSISLTSNGSNSDGSTDSFLASLSCQLGDYLGVGLEAGAEYQKYNSEFLNGGATYHAGPTMSYELSRYLHLRASAGYQTGSYDNGGAVQDNSSLGTYYANVAISNNLNSHFNHSLSFGREAQVGAFSNFTTTEYVSYSAQFDLINGVSMGASASFQDIQESGGLFAEHFQTFSVGIYCGLNLTKRITLSLGYTFTKRSAPNEQGSQAGSLDYDENRVSLHMGYAF